MSSETVEPPVPTVLIADDALVDRHKAAGIIAQQLGWRVVHAENGRAALDAVAVARPTVVLTDLQMPELDGLALSEELHAKYPFLPVVLMTAYGSEDTAIEALRRGAASYVPKKSLGKELAETLEQVVSAAEAGFQKQRFIQQCLRETECYYVLENDPALLRPMVARLQDDLAGMRLCGDSRRLHVGVALEEALTNALYHGNLEVSSALRQDGDTGAYRRTADERRRLAPYRDRRIHVRARLAAGAEGVIAIRDEGPGFDPNSLPDPTDPENMAKACGRGLLLIRTFVDEVGFNPTGNEITLRVRPDAGS
jgi:CheY-like chemotaxis protein/anti-sigma regulatory factor (Ser/Thr protein kinase)